MWKIKSEEKVVALSDAASSDSNLVSFSFAYQGDGHSIFNKTIRMVKMLSADGLVDLTPNTDQKDLTCKVYRKGGSPGSQRSPAPKTEPIVELMASGTVKL